MTDFQRTDTIDPTDSAQIWDQITSCLQRFTDMWESAAEPPDYRPLLASLHHDVQCVAIIEIVKLDMDYRFREDHQRLKIEDYVKDNPGLLEIDGIEADLLYEEYHLRRRSGEEVSVDEYAERFPRQVEALRRLVDTESETMTTKLYRSDKSTEFHVGDQVDDFDLLASLGKGAFATVYLARQRSLQRLVALKISADEGTEPQTLAQLDHPNIARVYDNRVLAQRGCQLLYMKYVPGGTLQDAIQFAHDIQPEHRNGATLVRAVDTVLDRRGETAPHRSALRQRWLDLSWSQTVCELGIQLSDALQYAHRKQVLHRDLKPANILLTAEAAPQLVDFNVSFCSKLDGASPSAFFGGSLAYMSPEQLEACNSSHDRRPDELQPASDIYSLAIVLWELYFGRRPFRDQSISGGWSDTLNRMCEERKAKPKRPAGLIDQVDRQGEHLLKLLDGCFEFSVDDRQPRTARQLKHELRLCANLEAKEILHPSPSGMLGFAQRHLVLTLFIIVLFPNILAAGFNLAYNFFYIVNELAPRTGQDGSMVVGRFMKIQTMINMLAFPIAILLILYRYLPIVRVVQQVRAGELVDGERLKQMRHRAIRFAQYIVMVTVTTWILAGILYPLIMSFSGITLRLEDRLHFICSLVLSGIIGNAYPYVAQSLFSLRAIYPHLNDPCDDSHLEDTALLEDLSQRTWFFLALSIMLPMFAVMLMVTFGEASHRIALGILSLISLVGSAAVFWQTKLIQNGVKILIEFYKGEASSEGFGR